MPQHQNSISVRIRRGVGTETSEFKTYKVTARANQTILDVVSEIQRRFEPALAYRFACRVGVCGSCAMSVNGIPRWTCRTHVNKVVENNTLTIEPLRNLPRIKDLVSDMTGFFDKWHRAGGRFVQTKTRHDQPLVINAKSKSRRAANAGIECINCAVCYSACDVVNWNKDYAGPAALNRIWTLINDQRHAARQETFDKAFSAGGCSSCHSQGNCTRHCPIGLSPSESIAGLKRSALFGLPKMDRKQ